jgi:hypothetical protein
MLPATPVRAYFPKMEIYHAIFHVWCMSIAASSHTQLPITIVEAAKVDNLQPLVEILAHGFVVDRTGNRTTRIFRI